MKKRGWEPGAFFLSLVLPCSLHAGTASVTEDRVDRGVTFAYVADGDNGVVGYAIDPNKKIVATIDCGGGKGCKGANFATGKSFRFRELVVDPTGRFAYVANSDSEDVTAFAVDSSTGRLTPIDCGGGKGCKGSNFAAGARTWSVTIHPSGKFAYVANKNESISAYAIDPDTGALRKIPCGNESGCEDGNFGAEDTPDAVTIHPSGKFAYVANFSSHDVTGYTINQTTGALTRIVCAGADVCSARGNFAAGEAPESSVILHPDGRFAYVANTRGNDLTAYEIDTGTGALTRIACDGAGCKGPNYRTGAHPTQIFVDPSGRFAYTTNEYDSDISAFSINLKTGALTNVACGGGVGCNGDRFQAGQSPHSLVFDPTGKHAYVASGTRSFAGFAIDPSTGALKPMVCDSKAGCQGPYFETGFDPKFLALAPTGDLLYVMNSREPDVTLYNLNATTGLPTRILCSDGREQCSEVNFGGNPLKKRLAEGWQAFKDKNFAESASAFQWVVDQRPGSKEFSEAKFQLGYMYEIGLGIPRDMKKAEALYRAAARDEIEAYERWVLLFQNEGVRFSEWLRLFADVRRRAESGSGGNEYALAYLYLYGIGIGKDERKAAEWMKRAAEKDNPHALYLLGVMSKRGIGMSANQVEAKKLLARAEQMGSRGAAQALKTRKPDLPDVRRLQTKSGVCASAKMVRQAGFPRRGEANAFEDFRQRLRGDLVDALTGAPSGETRFANSIDEGRKGKALRDEIGKIGGSQGYVPPLWIMLQAILTTTCPVGNGGFFRDEGKKVELWYVDFGNQRELDVHSVFSTYHLPPYGKTERKVFPTLVFTRDKTGKLIWYALSSENALILQRWQDIQFQ